MPEREGTVYPGAEPEAPPGKAFPAKDSDGKKALEKYKAGLETKYPNRAVFTDKVVAGKEKQRVGLLMKRDDIEANIKRLPTVYAQGQANLAPVAEALRRIESYADAHPDVELGGYPDSVVDKDTKQMIAALLGHQQKLGKNRGTVNFVETNPGLRNETTMTAATGFLNTAFHSSLTAKADVKWFDPPKPVPGDKGRNRAGCTRKTAFNPPAERNLIQMPNHRPFGSLIHEMGHSFEIDNSQIFDAMVSFLEARIQQVEAQRKAANDNRPPIQNLKDLKAREGAQYAPTGDYAVDDYFYNFYCGRIYNSASNSLPATGKYLGTELFSKGLELLAVDPLVWYNRDAEHFYAILGSLGG